MQSMETTRIWRAQKGSQQALDKLDVNLSVAIGGQVSRHEKLLERTHAKLTEMAHQLLEEGVFPKEPVVMVRESADVVNKAENVLLLRIREPIPGKHHPLPKALMTPDGAMYRVQPGSSNDCLVIDPKRTIWGDEYINDSYSAYNAMQAAVANARKTQNP